MKKKASKIISIILSVLLFFSVMPMTVLASDSVASVTTKEGTVTEFATLDEAFSFAGENANSLVTILSDVDLGEDYVSIESGEFTIDLNGKTISGTDLIVFNTEPESIITIKDNVGNGKIENIGDPEKTSSFLYSYTAVQHLGTLIIESGSFCGKNAITSFGHLILKGGFLEGWQYGIQIYTDDSHMAGIDGSGTYSGGTINGGIYIDNGYDDDAVVLNDLLASGYGFFDEEDTEIFVTEGQYKLLKNISIKESTNQKPYNAVVTFADGTEEYFISIASAFSKARLANNNEYSTITLLRDCSAIFDLSCISYAKTIIFDLNGFVLSSNGSGIFTTTRNYCGIDTLVIKDSKNTGEIIFESTTTTQEEAIRTSGNLVLENVKITSNEYGISAKNLTMTNCTVSAEIDGVSGINMTIRDSIISSGLHGIRCADKGEVSIYNTEITSVKYGIYGGKPQLYDGTKVVSTNDYPYPTLSPNGTSADCLPEGHFYYDLNGNQINYTNYPANMTRDFVVKNKYPVSVIQPDGTTEYFPSVDEGLNAANKDFDSILKILTDILLNSTLTFKGTTTLDLNGKTLETEDEYTYTVVVDKGASVVIEDSSNNGTIAGGGVAVNGGTLNFNNGNIESTMDGIYNNGGDAIVNGGAISCGEGYDDIFVEGDNTTKVYGGVYEDGFSIGGTTINETLADGYVFYNGEGAVEITDNQKEVSENVVVYEKTIVTAMSSQIRFNKSDDGSYAGTFDVRTRAKISDADFNKYIAESNEDAINKISKVGFVYAQVKNGFDINVAKTVAQGGQADGFIDAPVSYIQDADGYYMFTCLVTGIPEEDVDNGLTAYAYICVDNVWYFFPVEVTAEFGEMYSTYYPIAAEQYGWEV
ncbi:MAG: hypothetical protein IJB72_03700 [Clostridia bacterium]|nr:hypothetical protein [Clostridia bacterium]